jgi:hypothetical protein
MFVFVFCKKISIVFHISIFVLQRDRAVIVDNDAVVLLFMSILFSTINVLIYVTFIIRTKIRMYDEIHKTYNTGILVYSLNI